MKIETVSSPLSTIEEIFERIDKRQTSIKEIEETSGVFIVTFTDGTQANVNEAVATELAMAPVWGHQRQSPLIVLPKEEQVALTARVYRTNREKEEREEERKNRYNHEKV